MKAKSIATLCTAVLLATGLTALPLQATAQSARPIIFEIEGKTEGNETVGYTLPEEKAAAGNAISLKVFLKSTYHYSLPVTVSMQADGHEYSWSQTAGTLKGYAYSAADAEEATEQTNLQWNKLGTLEIPYLFYGEIVLPFSALNYGAGAEVSSVEAISLTATAAVNSNFASGDTWIVDGVSLYLFEANFATVEGGSVTIGEEIVDFTQLQPTALTHETSRGNCVGELQKATKEDVQVFRAFVNEYNSECEQMGDIKLIETFSLGSGFSSVGTERASAEFLKKFYRSGQIAGCEQVLEAGNCALAYHIDSGDYDAGKNSYAGLHFNFAKKEATNWSGAKGITVFVENTSSCLASFALEVFQYNLSTGLLEQYNLNDVGQKYKTAYAYNVETGEEFSYHTQTFLRVPANFKGWIRIPFSQYAAPAWSMAPAYGNEGVLDFDVNPVVKISMTRLFNVNLEMTLIIDNVGLYYSDFGVGSLFDDSVPSIRECVENGSVSV